MATGRWSDGTPRLTIGVPAEVGEEGLATTLDLLRDSAERSMRDYEIVVAVNGPGEQVPALAGVRAFADRHRLALVDGTSAAPTPADDTQGRGRPVRVLRLAERGKVRAWNAVRHAARADTIVFVDADVRIVPEAIGALAARLEAEGAVALVGGREVPVVEPDDGLVARVAALPYRSMLGNVPGRLYAVRTAACPAELPATVLAEDAYLTIHFGAERLAREDAAVVHFRPPATWAEYVRDHVRNEVAKLQLVREFPDLSAAHGAETYPWRRLLGTLRAADVVPLVLALAVRAYAKVRAQRSVRRGVRPGWRLLPSTKRWR